MHQDFKVVRLRQGHSIYPPDLLWEWGDQHRGSFGCPLHYFRLNLLMLLQILFMLGCWRVPREWRWRWDFHHNRLEQTKVLLYNIFFCCGSGPDFLSYPSMSQSIMSHKISSFYWGPALCPQGRTAEKSRRTILLSFSLTVSIASVPFCPIILPLGFPNAYLCNQVSFMKQKDKVLRASGWMNTWRFWDGGSVLPKCFALSISTSVSIVVISYK